MKLNKHIVKKYLKYLINLAIKYYYTPNNPILILTKKNKAFRNYIYTLKYCKLLSCKNVWFEREINTIKGEKYIRIGEGTRFGKMVVLTAWNTYMDQSFSPFISIGQDCNFGDFLHITCINKISIGNNVLTGRWVTITDNGHGKSKDVLADDPPEKRILYSKDETIIEDNVWIGDKVTILPGVKIGKGCIIGANSVVTSDVPPYSIVVGNPAKIVKKYTK